MRAKSEIHSVATLPVAAGITSEEMTGCVMVKIAYRINGK